MDMLKSAGFSNDMKKTKNIVLIGFMGAGKSSVAQWLAEQLGWPVVSTDELIVQLEKRPINEIFANSGEPYFRQVEKKIVQEVSLRQEAILDCGGGVVLDKDNVANLKKSGILFYLKASPAEIFRRVQPQTHRPLLNTPHPQEKIKELLEKRAAFYAEADHTIDTTGKSVEQVGQAILAVLNG